MSGTVELEPPSLPGYEIGSMLGRGGTCGVFRARRVADSQWVAIKFLLRYFEEDHDLLERFRREAVLGRSLDHPHIVRIHDQGSIFQPHAGPPWWFAMDLIEGQMLSELIRSRNGQPFSEPDICRLIIPVCNALDYAHRRRPPVVHRDVKPANIAIGSDGTVRLMDFGIAQQMGQDRLTRPLSFIATPEYMAPERARSEEIDGRSDLYSLGVVMYELATGRLPFQRESHETDLCLVERHTHELPMPPRSLRPGLSETMNETILKLLAKRKELRFASAAELGEALRTHLRRLEHSAGPPTGRHAAPSGANRSGAPAMVLATGGIVLSVILFAAVGYLGMQERSRNSVLIGRMEKLTLELKMLGEEIADQRSDLDARLKTLEKSNGELLVKSPQIQTELQSLQAMQQDASNKSITLNATLLELRKQFLELQDSMKSSDLAQDQAASVAAPLPGVVPTASPQSEDVDQERIGQSWLQAIEQRRRSTPIND